MDRTLILVKPDAFARGLTGEIIARFERKGLKIVALKHMTVTEDLAKQHYAEHDGKPFFGELVEFITSGPIVAMVLEGDQAITAARQVIGATNPLEASPGSIRGDFAIAVGQNMVHGSDSAGVGPARGRAVLPRPLVLASASPQRRAILEEAGIAFEVRPANVDELTEGDPREVALENARRKALAIPGDARAGRRHRRRARRRDPRQAARRRARPRARRAGSTAARTRWWAGSRSPATARSSRTAVEITRVTFRESDAATLDRVRGDRGVGGARGRLRDPGRGQPLWSATSTATTSTSSGCRSQRLKELLATR